MPVHSFQPIHFPKVLPYFPVLSTAVKRDMTISRQILLALTGWFPLYFSICPTNILPCEMFDFSGRASFSLQCVIYFVCISRIAFSIFIRLNFNDFCNKDVLFSVVLNFLGPRMSPQSVYWLLLMDHFRFHLVVQLKQDLGFLYIPWKRNHTSLRISKQCRS